MDQFIIYDEQLCAYRKINNHLTNKAWELFEILGYIHEGRLLNDDELIEFKIKCKRDRLFIALGREQSMETPDNLCICKCKTVKHFHYIKHTVSDMILVVGSKCIDKFMNEKDIKIINDRHKLLINKNGICPRCNENPISKQGVILTDRCKNCRRIAIRWDTIIKKVIIINNEKDTIDYKNYIRCYNELLKYEVNLYDMSWIDMIRYEGEINLRRRYIKSHCGDIMPFGKYKGKRFDKVITNSHYIQNLLDNGLEDNDYPINKYIYSFQYLLDRIK